MIEEEVGEEGEREGGKREKDWRGEERGEGGERERERGGGEVKGKMFEHVLLI